MCIDRLREAGRRPLPRDLQDACLDVGAPLVPALDVPWLMPAPAGWSGGSVVEQGAERSGEVRLAVTAVAWPDWYAVERAFASPEGRAAAADMANLDAPTRSCLYELPDSPDRWPEVTTEPVECP